MTVAILRIGNSLSLLLFILAIILSAVGEVEIVLGLMKFGLFTLLFTPVCRLVFVGWESLKGGEFRARKWMALVVIMLLVLSILLGIRH
ncbi:hypothetical protein GW916_01710 [bacterium]|nr:hypothetical protein [bacterium]